MSDIFNMADTWNAGGTTFSAIKMDVTDTASAADSMLEELLIGGSRKWSVGKTNARIYNVYSGGGANFEFGGFLWSSNKLLIGCPPSSAGGTGANRTVQICSQSGSIELNDGNSTVRFTSGVAEFPAKAIHAYSGTAIPAGGTAGQGLRIFSTTNFGVFGGSGAPTLSAAKGSLYLRSDGSGTSDRMYVNTDGSTTWTAVATAA